ncbi:MAG: UbiA family prenyltransferase [Actinomycetales bacterium]|nr:UbiA family prenyltransferase [Actinomycetales bacterium]
MSGGPPPARRPAALALLASTHPAPVLVVATVSVLLALAMGLGAVAVALVGLARLAEQAAVGWVNDVVDAEADRRDGRTDKPVAAGEVSRRRVVVTAVLAATVAIAAAAVLGPGPLLALLGILAAGIGYDLGLKRTPLSLLCYLVGFSLLPVLPALALPEPRLPALWVVLAAALLGAAAHAVNVLPDLERDRAEGVRGLPQILGRRGAVVLLALALAGAALAIVVGLGAAPVSFVVVAVTAGAGGAGILVMTRRPRSRLPFLLLLAAVLVDVAALVLAGSALLG